MGRAEEERGGRGGATDGIERENIGNNDHNDTGFITQGLDYTDNRSFMSCFIFKGKVVYLPYSNCYLLSVQLQ